MLLSLAAAHAQALPKGGQYVAGSGSIAATGGAMTITQSSTHGIINWQGFSIGSANKVWFNNGNGATLNRVMGGNLSQIDGLLSATGSVYLINPSGLVVGPGGKIITGGSFIGSTLGISNQQFMQGGALGFSNGSGGPNGAVINNGKIVSQNGNVALIGYSASNLGNILAPAGTVAVAAGNHVLLKPLNGPAGIYVTAGTSGNATNSGRIKAAAAAIESAGGNVYELAGNQTGLIDATGSQAINGQVWLTAPAGTVKVSGTVEAQNANGSGGAIIAKGQSVALSASSSLNAAGLTGGGQIETSGESVSAGGGKVNAGPGGSWLLDPNDLTIDSALAGTMETSLNGGTNVTEQTTASGTGGSGDISVESNIAWTTAASLTLSAYRNITIDTGVTISNSGSGNLTLRADNASTGTGAVTFNGTGNLDFSGSTGDVSILYDPANYASPVSYSSNVTTNSSWTAPSNQAVSSQLTAYMLINNVTDLSSVSTNLSGTYALGTNIDASSVSNFTPLGSFSGILDGQSNTINGLTSTGSGLITTINSGGIVRNLGLTNVSINSSNSNVGGLAGTNSGTIVNTYVTGSVTSNNSSGGNAGGLVGTNAATIASSYSTANVNASIGDAGNGGGLIGAMNSGTVTDSYSSGPVTGNGTNMYTGGFLGWGQGGTISYSYSSSVVGGGGTSSSTVGGFVGENDATTISNSYASGPVSGSGSGTYLGAFAGVLNHATSDSYAVGAVVAGSGVVKGGFAASGTCTSSCYWDSETTGISSGGPGTSQTTAQLQSSLPSGLSSSTWGLITNKSFPYFFWQYPSSTTPQVISGTIYAGLSSTPLTGVAVSSLVNGSLAGVATSTGANGYYNQLLPQGTISNSGSQVLTYISFNGTGNTFNENATGSLTNNNVYSGYLQINSSTSTASQMIADLSTALGSNSGSNFLFSTSGGSLTMSGSNNLALTSTAPSLALDAPISASSGTIVMNAAGPVTQSAALSAGHLLLGGSNASYTISDTSNAIGTVAANTGAVNVSTSGALTVGSVDSTNGIQSSGNVALDAGTNLTLSNSISATGNGNAIVLGTGGDFVNNVGSSVLGISGGGRWLIYSQNPANDTVDGLVNAFKQYDATYGMTSAAQTSGNGFLYTLAPVLSVGLTGSVSKTYDGTTTATLNSSNYTLSGAIQGDSVSLNDPTSGTFSDKNVGTSKTVTVGGLSVTATNGSVNVYGYQVPSSTGGSIGTITPASLTAGLTGTVSKTYDGTTVATLTPGNYTLSGVIGSDQVTLNNPVSGTYASQNAGTGIAVTASALTLNGSDAANYTLASATATGNIGTITPASLTAGLTGTVSKTYDGTTTATLAPNNYTLSGVIGSDQVTLNNPASGIYTSQNAGTGIGVMASGLTLGGAAAGNYTLASTTATGNIGAITPASLTAGLTGTVSKTYDGTTTATLAPNNYTLSGVIGSDQVTLNNPASGTYASQNAGTGIAVTASGLTLGGAATGNYTLASTTATGNIGTITPASLTAGLTGTVSKTYDGTTAATLTPGNYTLSGVIGSDQVTLNNPTSGTYASQNAGTGIGVMASGLMLGGAAAGNYTLASTTATGNIGTITPASLTAGLTGTVSKTYDGTTTATLAPNNYTLSGVIGSDQVTLNNPTSGIYATAETGTGIPVTVTGLSLFGADASDYILSRTSITGNVGIIKTMVSPQTTLLPFITTLPTPVPASSTGSLVLVGAGNGFGPIPLILLPSNTVGTTVTGNGIAFSTGVSLTVDPEQTLNQTGGVRRLDVNLPPVSGSGTLGGQQ